ncbi:hypothetical protein pb186bvf_017927 [Paramecium bursaria]
MIRYHQNSLDIDLTTGKLKQLTMKDRQIILDNNPHYLGSGSYLLFPWVNRISESEFPPQFTDGNDIPLHGLYASAERKIIQQQDNFIEIEPIKFHQNHKFTEKYEFENENTLIITFRLDNPDELPFGVGFHPYFLFDNVDLVEIITNLDQNLITNEKLLPQGDQLEWTQYKFGQLQDIQLDNCFKQSQNEPVHVIVKHPQYQLHLEGEQFRYWQFYIPPDRKSIAIEPQTSTVDQYKQKTYKTDKLFEAKFIIRI